MRDAPPDFAGEYRRVLLDYLAHGGEGPLHDAYELGRKALGFEMGLLDLIHVHQETLKTALEENPAGANDTTRRLDAAARFLAETLSPFEMFRLGSEEANAALRRLNQILEEEAKRIAHVLHDEAAQLLATVYLELAEIGRELPGSVEARVKRVTEHLDQVREQLRRLSHELRPPILDQLGLVPALRFLADGVRERAGLAVIVGGETGGRLSQPIETAVYRVVQEALTNVTKHAHATRADVRVWIDDATVNCTVRDDGIGFERSDAKAPASRGLGLIGIQERVSSMHGSVKFTSSPGRGTELLVSIPLER
jgi:signal transduction histidine kinase